MRPTPSLVAVVVALAAALAGCSNPPAAPAEIVIESAPAEEIRSGEEALGEAPLTEVFEEAASSRGHIAGVVVDEAIRPIHGAKVRLPGMNMERPTERDGSFGFVDLYAGPYYLTVEMDGYYMAEAMLEVQPEEFTRAKVVLAAIPPPEPYHTTQAFEGFADVGATPAMTGMALCTACEFDFYVDRQGLHSVILEVAYETASSSSRSFWVDFGPYDSSTYLCFICEGMADPVRIEVRAEDLPEGDRFSLGAEPQALVPETNIRFRVFVTAFYNEGPPTGWSIVNGDI